MDAFGTVHRAHASVTGVTRHLCPCVMGFVMQQEMTFLQGIMDDLQHPAAAIIGGAKVPPCAPHATPARTTCGWNNYGYNRPGARTLRVAPGAFVSSCF